MAGAWAVGVWAAGVWAVGAWGDAVVEPGGPQVVASTPVGGGQRRPEEDELARQVREAWDYLDWLRARELEQAAAVAPAPAVPAPAVAAPVAQPAPIAPAAREVVAQVATIAAAAATIADQADLAAEAERIALARRQADEEALLLILSELA